MGNTLKFAERQKDKLKKPQDYKVVLLNDDWTSMDFVVDILKIIFHKNDQEAERTMLEVHRNGRGVAGVYTFDIARTKAEQVHCLAAKKNFPLKCVLELA
ncbi:MAG: ATP-dependent Clp protease adapter ClpS [Spirochaetaceae bacterium]|jgi:ATP-dependent Clp protease adaptor protein ClpS|nr:ATP-dependent Clp protease adapter ClpS [Spirochaetaceae bacterium]